MTFHPRMTSRVEGVSVIGELKWRSWTGVIADVWSVRCTSHASGEYVSEAPRLFVILDKAGPGTFGVGTDSSALIPPRCTAPNAMSYIPAGLPVWGRVHDVDYLRHLDLHFDINTFKRRFPDEVLDEKLSTPRLMFFSERIASLAGLIAAECLSDQPLHDLYGDGLTLALFTELFGICQPIRRQRSQLSPRQLGMITNYIEDNCLQNIRLQELAELAGLSQSYFSHAFKASTGSSPHRWQMNARIRRVQGLLQREGVTLTRVASAAGFSDQAHLTRVFKSIVGVTPAAWQRSQTN